MYMKINHTCAPNMYTGCTMIEYQYNNVFKFFILATSDQELIISALAQSSFKRSSNILGLSISDLSALDHLSDDFVQRATQTRTRTTSTRIQCRRYRACLLENGVNSRLACQRLRCPPRRNNRNN